jgi:hypothetical protein
MAGKEKGKGKGGGGGGAKAGDKKKARRQTPPPTASSCFRREQTHPPPTTCVAETNSQALKAAWFVEGARVLRLACRGRAIQIQIPMGRPPLPRRRGRHARAALIEKRLWRKSQPGRFARMRSPSQKLVAKPLSKPLPLSKKYIKCPVSGTISPGVRYIKVY